MVDPIDKSFIETNKNLIWTNGKNKGYVELEIYSEFVEVKFNYVSTVKSKRYNKLEPISFKINHNKPMI